MDMLSVNGNLEVENHEDGPDDENCHDELVHKHDKNYHAIHLLGSNSPSKLGR